VINYVIFKSVSIKHLIISQPKVVTQLIAQTKLVRGHLASPTKHQMLNPSHNSHRILTIIYIYIYIGRLQRKHLIIMRNENIQY
jgi:hypothetical protein